MGEIADDMVNGACCSHCGTYFVADHDHPVLCRDCYDNETKAERVGLQRATEEEI